ncbi:tripartite tricarboxylate transporter TctB family protein [Ureibacillus acetophenoni]|uniref:Putative tricarboxylic transport membrane protein n=1 Tax=Ureibacillus acetophenoni TaxID=614649 RepID=A0A285TZX2_9BACL|nr:tripartite tricarboxylate transporter TctB family protein [Ureibacillus acetophenoni]SOC35234.1 putative tricarboxylic transport membrane protein [Ureibacillus acetophenoni]
MSKTFDKFTGVIFLLISILFIFESLKISGSAYGSAVGPKTFPLILGVVLGLLSLRLLYETFKLKSEKEEKETFNYKRFGIIFVSAVAYVFLLEIIGYVLSTFIFLVIAFQVMEKGKLLYTLIIAAFFTFGVYAMYVQVLGGSLPRFSLF